MSQPFTDVPDYYRRITSIDIGEVARELLNGRITQSSERTLLCDCPNHQSQSKRSLNIMVDKQGWYCFGCGTGGDVLQLVEFVRAGCVTSGQSGRMPHSHRDARDFLAEKAGLPRLARAGLSVDAIEELEREQRENLRIFEALTALADYYHRRLLADARILSWFCEKYRIGDELIARLKIGYAENEPWCDATGSKQAGVLDVLCGGPNSFKPTELSATSAFKPNGSGISPFFDRRIVFPYWSRGHVVFMIGRQTPWTPETDWEKPKYRKLAVRNTDKNAHVASCIRNDVLFNEDILLRRPERVIITEGITDCISLIEHGFPAVSPVTVQIKEADWERILPKLAGAKTVYICQDNELSEAGIHGALKTAGVLIANGICAKVASLPLGEKQKRARQELDEHFAIETNASAKDLPQQARSLIAEAKIDVNEFFVSGKTAADFEQILGAAQTPLERAISKLSQEIPTAELARELEPILIGVDQTAPIEQTGHLLTIQNRCGKDRVSISALREQMRVVRIGRQFSGKAQHSNGTRTPGPFPAASVKDDSTPWRGELLLNLNGSVKPVLANAITALRTAPHWAGVLAHNEFAHCTTIKRAAPWMKPTGDPPAEWTGNEDVLATDWLHHQGIFVSVETTGQAIETVAREHLVHPVRKYLDELVWDGNHRLESWLSDHLGVEPSPYAEAVGSRWMISAVARIFEPGCKADCCLILEGEQGIRKSTALRVLTDPWFADEIADLGSKDAALQTRGIWVIEIAELDSMSRSDVGRTKAFMSRASDRFRPPYGKRLIESPRQCVFAGSVNHGAYLRDETGGRRFWPVLCKSAMINVNALADVRDQLWAEAACSYFDGKPWWMDSVALDREAVVEQADRYEGDPWDELILAWTGSLESVSIAEVLTSCLEKKKDVWTLGDKLRVARCLRASGWKRFNAGPRGAREWRYRNPK